MLKLGEEVLRYLSVMLELVFEFRQILNNSLPLLALGSFCCFRNRLVYIIDCSSLLGQLRLSSKK
jgi:hypothetical protein